MSTLLTRMFARPRAHCADCQDGQGKHCACRQVIAMRKRNPRRQRISDLQWLWLLIVVDVAVVVGVCWLAVHIVQSWRAS